MRILFSGDVVGPPGVTFLQKALPALRRRERLDLVIANAENACNGSGLTAALYRKIRNAGVDLVTLGDHIYKKAEIIPTLQEDARVCRPANFPPDAPGHEFAFGTTKGGIPVAAFCVLGRQFMRPVDCPFRAADRVLKELEGVPDGEAPTVTGEPLRTYWAGARCDDREVIRPRTDPLKPAAGIAVLVWSALAHRRAAAYSSASRS